MLLASASCAVHRHAAALPQAPAQPDTGAEPGGEGQWGTGRDLRRLRQEHHRLSVDAGELYDGTGKASCAEVEGHDVVLSCAVQAAVRPESQSPGPAESGGASGAREHA